MTTRGRLVVCLRVRLRKSGYERSDLHPGDKRSRMLIWECLDDSRPQNVHIRQMGDELGYDESMTRRQTDGLIRDIVKEWY